MLDYYNLKEKPFKLLPNPRFLYLSDQYLETKSKLIYFLQDRSASLYLYGGVGNGKTTLLRLIAEEVSEDKKDPFKIYHRSKSEDLKSIAEKNL